MNTVTVTNNAGQIIEAELPSGSNWNAPVELSINGVWIGEGVWQNAIIDADARLGDTPAETEALYEALSAALNRALAQPAFVLAIGKDAQEWGRYPTQAEAEAEAPADEPWSVWAADVYDDPANNETGPVARG